MGMVGAPMRVSPSSLRNVSVGLVGLIVTSSSLGCSGGDDASPSEVEVGRFVVSWPGSDDTPRLTVTHADEPDHVLWSAQASEFLRVHRGQESVTESRGSFTFEDERVESCGASIVEGLEAGDDAATLLGSFEGCGLGFAMTFTPQSDHRLGFEIELSEPESESAPSFNRTVLTYDSSADEGFYGFGAQYNYGDHKGLRLPIWVQEQGLGRGLEPVRELLAMFGAEDSVGDWWTTYTGVPYYLSTKRRGFAVENLEYMVFDMERDDAVQLEVFSGNLRGQIHYGETLLDLVEANTEWTGRMEPLPEWIHRGPIIRVSGGSEAIRAAVAELEGQDAPVSAIWIEDWAGSRQTITGTRMWWNWVVDPDLYPDWEELVDELRQKNIRILIYFNPFLADATTKENAPRNLFAEATEAGYVVNEPDGDPVLVENGGFDAALVDLTNPEAREFLAAIMREQIAIGVSGWMADFGEALPYRAMLASGVDSRSYHNDYPRDWAALNREVVEGEGVYDDFLFFSRSGNARSPGASRLFWIGDQMCSWDAFDGFKTVIPALVSSGISGYSLSHSDTGGYLSLSSGSVQYTRSEELLQRWMELNTFTPVLRMHTGNLPDLNAQYDSTPELLAFYARMGKVFVALTPYRERVMQEAAERGWPAVRHPLLHFPDDPAVRDLAQQFMFGSEFMVAPVVDEGATSVEVYLPAGRWVHVWTGETHGSADAGSRVTLEAPLGRPVVLYPEGSSDGEAFVAALDAEGLR